MNPPTATGVLSNPFPSGRGESYPIVFATLGAFLLPENRWHQPVNHTFWALDVAIDRPLRARVANREIIRPTGSVGLYAPHTIYQYYEPKGLLQREAWLLFHVRDPRSPLRALTRPDGYRYFEDPAGLVRTPIEQIFSAFYQRQPAGEWFARSAFFQIVALLCAARGEPFPSIHLPDRSVPPTQTSLRRRVENFLYAHPRRSVAAREVAAHVGFSLSTFTHRYREVAGETFRQTKRRIQIEQAKALLLEPDSSIKQVARDLGFGDAAHFSRAFRAGTGMSPGAFMKIIAPRVSGRQLA